MRDPEAKEWVLPCQGTDLRYNTCAGKSQADAVESLIGAHFLTNDNLYKTLQWISDIKLVPLQQVNQLERFKNIKESTYSIIKTVDLNDIPFNKEDCVASLMEKYYALEQVENDPDSAKFKTRIEKMIFL